MQWRGQPQAVRSHHRHTYDKCVYRQVMARHASCNMQGINLCHFDKLLIALTVFRTDTSLIGLGKPQNQRIPTQFKNFFYTIVYGIVGRRKHLRLGLCLYATIQLL